MKEQWQLAKSIFNQAIELPLSERAVFISQNCTDDTMREHVAKLVELHFEDSSFLETPISNDDNTETAMVDPIIGQQLGNFKVVRRIGRGGMGTVYEAEQSNPNRLAAIKVLRFDHAVSETQLKRFKHESEVLARLQHPGIAHVYASGSFDFGQGSQPWFAMELVEGKPLNVFLNSVELLLSEKLELLVKICAAVQHAHDRGVIHRDLKPANIIIQNSSSPQEPGRPKVVDFGVARVSDAALDRTMLTAAGDIIGTLDYLSPEQVGADRDKVDCRCDVYALGVIGFEIIAGELPHDRRSGSIADAISQIGRVDSLPLGKVRASFSRDLEIILAKALESSPSRRYQTVQLLADDINRFLDQQPILARAPSTPYRVAKFVRRNLTLVLGTLATMLALLVGMVLYANEARDARLAESNSKIAESNAKIAESNAKIAESNARYEAEKAVAVNSYITNDFLTKLLAAANTRIDGKPFTITELVDASATNIDTMFAEQPLIRAAIRNEIGTIYYNVGDPKAAANQYRLAMELWEANLKPDHPDIFKAVNNLAQARMGFDSGQETEQLYRRAFEGRKLSLGEDNPATLITMNNLAELLRKTDRIEEAEKLLRTALAIQQKALGEFHKDTLITSANLGSLLASQGQEHKAKEIHQHVYDGAKSTLGAEHITTLLAGFQLVQTLLKTEEYDQALETMKPVLTGFRNRAGDDKLQTINAERLMSRVYARLNDQENARKHLQVALDAATEARIEDARRKIERDFRRLDRQARDQKQKPDVP